MRIVTAGTDRPLPPQLNHIFRCTTFAQTNKNAYFCSAISNKGLVVQLNRTQDSGS